MNEPSEDFRWDEVEHNERLAAPMTSEQERAAVERGARAFANIVLLSGRKKLTKNGMRLSQVRIAIVSRLFKIPGWEQYASNEAIGRIFGVSGQCVRALADGLRKDFGMRPEIGRAYTVKRKRARHKS